MYRFLPEYADGGCSPAQQSAESSEPGHRLLCAIAKKQGSGCPCEPFCINPFESFALAAGYRLDVQETLWRGKRCLFINTREKE